MYGSIWEEWSFVTRVEGLRPENALAERRFSIRCLPLKKMQRLHSSSLDDASILNQNP